MKRVPNRISWDGTGFAIDGQKFFPYSGEMHHFRVHPDLWKDRLLKMKRAFCNCTGAYFYWGAIEPTPGEFNFEGICDLRRYFDTIAEVGMLAIPRPGGYICAEVDSGGHPNWLYPRVTQMRDLDPEYISASERYYAAVNDILRDFDIETGARGKIIFLYQLENEYFWGNIPYHQKLREILVNQYGESAPFIVNANRFARGSDPAIFDTIDHYPDKWIMQPTKPMVREMITQQPTFPCFGMEIEGGWFSAFGAGEEVYGYSYRGHFPSEWTDMLVKGLIGAGMSGLNYYMFHGGTNFGYWGAKYMTTTYDYGAPIAEWGGLADRYWPVKTIGSFLWSFGARLAEMPPNDDFLYATDQDKKLYAWTRSNGESAFIFTFNEDTTDQVLPIKLKNGDRILPEVAMPAQRAKILPYNVEILRGIVIEFATIEPYLCCQVDQGKQVLLFHGAPGENFQLLFFVDGEEQTIEGAISPEDQYWRLKCAGGEAIVGVVETPRAYHTWLAEVGGRQLPVVSNLYFLRDFAQVEGCEAPVIELHAEHQINETLVVTLPWFNCPSVVEIDGMQVPVDINAKDGVGRFDFEVEGGTPADFEVNLGNVAGSPWLYRAETLGQEGSPSTWKPWVPNQSLEDMGFFKNGFSIFRAKMNLPADLPPSSPVHLFLSAAIDSANVFVNGQYAGHVQQQGSLDVTSLVAVSEEVDITIALECIGHYNHGFHETSGITGGVYLDFGSGALAEEANANMIPIETWQILINPDLPAAEITESCAFVNPTCEIDPDEWDDVIITPGKHAGIAFVPHNWTAGIYRATVAVPAEWEGRAVCLDFGRSTGRAWYFVNGKLVTQTAIRHDKGRTKIVEKLGIDVTQHLAYGAENTIVVVYSVKDNGDGIGEYVRLRACDVFAGTEWQAREQLDGEIAGWYAKEIISTDGWTETGSIAGLPRAPGHMFWVRNAVQVDTPADLWVPRYLELQGILGKCNVWWNGNFLGRYWDIGPQMKFYIPEPIIEMENQVTLLFLPCDGEAALEIPPAVKPFDIVRKSKWIIPIP